MICWKNDPYICGQWEELPPYRQLKRSVVSVGTLLRGINCSLLKEHLETSVGPLVPWLRNPGIN